MKDFDPELFIEIQIGKIREILGENKALIAVSGGVDSSTCAVLTHHAIGDNLFCVILDDAFMREKEPEKVVRFLSNPPLRLPIQIERVQQRFLKALKGLKDAEEKRLAFRNTFYKTMSEIAKREKCKFLVQGTILADIIETRNGIKTQHNVLEQIGISTTKKFGFNTVEPLSSLLKWQVREVARLLKIPSEISERQPFPGPGLSVRAVGIIEKDKLSSLKKATSLLEEDLTNLKISQYFVAIINNKIKTSLPINTKILTDQLEVHPDNILLQTFDDKATGILRKTRKYGAIAGLRLKRTDGEIIKLSYDNFNFLQESIIKNNPSVTRVLYLITEKDDKKPYVASIRAVNTEDFLTAEVTKIPWLTLKRAAKRILDNCQKISAVYYDITPKPPATIEME